MVVEGGLLVLLFSGGAVALAADCEGGGEGVPGEDVVGVVEEGAAERIAVVDLGVGSMGRVEAEAGEAGEGAPVVVGVGGPGSAAVQGGSGEAVALRVA